MSHDDHATINNGNIAQPLNDEHVAIVNPSISDEIMGNETINNHNDSLVSNVPQDSNTSDSMPQTQLQAKTCSIAFHQ
jgi:hypothetical protein